MHFEIFVDEFKFLHLIAWGGELVVKPVVDIYKMQQLEVIKDIEGIRFGSFNTLI